MKEQRQHKNNKGKSGFTLVEMLVAGVLLLLVIISVTAMMRHGQRINKGNQYQNIARQKVAATLERSIYDFQNYSNLVAGVGTTTENFILNDRGTAATTDDVNATLSTVVSFVDSNDAGNITGEPVPYILVSTSATWSDVDGTDTVTLQKYICLIE